MFINFLVSTQVTGRGMVKYTIHIGDIPGIRTGAGADHYHRAILYISAGNCIKRTERTHPILQRYSAQSTCAAIGVSSISRIELVNGADSCNAIKMFKRLCKMLDVISRDLKNLGNVELF